MFKVTCWITGRTISTRVVIPNVKVPELGKFGPKSIAKIEKVEKDKPVTADVVTCSGTFGCD